MPSRVVVYKTILILWFLVAAPVGYASISKARELLNKLSTTWELEGSMEKIAVMGGGMADNSWASLNWGEFNRWAAKMWEGRLS
ncbi:MAG: hypothetical protein FJZ49_03305 [Candidatus Verstraetearchaeota archaeon]|nr:hypothetical protein [Candidatus Verstraetearchaeota archaeon]